MLNHEAPVHQDSRNLPPPVASGALTGESELHLLDRLNVLYKRRKTIITVLVTVMIGAVVQVYTAVPMYEAVSQVMIEEEGPVPGGFRATELYYQDPLPYYETQYRILAGRDLARAVAVRLQLQTVPEFNGTLPPPSGLKAGVDAVRSLIRNPIAFVQSKFAATPTHRPAATRPDESMLVDSFLGRLRVQPVRESRLVNIFVASINPEFAARAANAVAEEYVTRNLDAKLLNTEKTLEWLGQELERQRKTVEEGERALTQYRERNDALSLEGGQNIVVSRLNQLNDAVGTAKADRVQKETSYNQVQSLGTSADVDTVAAVTNSAILRQLKVTLTGLQDRRLDLSARYGERHPEIVKVNAQIEETLTRLNQERDKAIESVGSDYRRALSHERNLMAELERQKQAAMELSAKGIDYKVLDREAQSNRQIYEQLLSRQKELAVVRNSKENNVRLTDRAEVPKGPVNRNPQRDLLVSLAIGLTLGIGLAFGLEYLDDTIKTPEDITRHLKVPFLGVVPAVRGEKAPVVTDEAPHDFGEAFRTLRTALVFSSNPSTTRVILVTSTQPLEGKTTTAANLALVLALGGARVLVIDADMRRPGLHKALGIKNNIGLSHVLVGQARVRESIQRMQDPNVFVMTAGRTPPNPSELLSSERMSALLANLSTGPFDWVIVDTPPVLAVTDALVLAPIVHSVVLVVGAEMTRRRLVERAIEMLMGSRPHVLGAILNRVDFQRNKYYYSRYYGYQYKSYYGQAPAKA